MIPQITLGGAALMAALVGATWLVRWAVAPTAARNRRASETTIEIPLAGLKPFLPDAARPYGALVGQAIAWCPLCRADVAVVLHREGAHRCDRNHVTITRAEAAS